MRQALRITTPACTTVACRACRAVLMIGHISSSSCECVCGGVCGRVRGGVWVGRGCTCVRACVRVCVCVCVCVCVGHALFVLSDDQLTRIFTQPKTLCAVLSQIVCVCLYAFRSCLWSWNIFNSAWNWWVVWRSAMPLHGAVEPRRPVLPPEQHQQHQQRRGARTCASLAP